jgi:hypothetical protein
MFERCLGILNSGVWNPASRKHPAHTLLDKSKRSRGTASLGLSFSFLVANEPSRLRARHRVK